MNSSSEARLQYCGAGGGAFYGAVTGAALFLQGGYYFPDRFDKGVVMTGVLLMPFGATIGAVDGAINNPCPDPAAPENESAPQASDGGGRRDKGPA